MIDAAPLLPLAEVAIPPGGVPLVVPVVIPAPVVDPAARLARQNVIQDQLARLHEELSRDYPLGPEDWPLH